MTPWLYLTQLPWKVFRNAYYSNKAGLTWNPRTESHNSRIKQTQNPDVTFGVLIFGPSSSIHSWVSGEIIMLIICVSLMARLGKEGGTFAVDQSEKCQWQGLHDPGQRLSWFVRIVWNAEPDQGTITGQSPKEPSTTNMGRLNSLVWS